VTCKTGRLATSLRAAVAGLAALLGLLVLTSAAPHGAGWPWQLAASHKPTVPPPPPEPPRGGGGIGYWHARGGQLVDETGAPVRMTGVSWFGPETRSFTFGGLGVRNYRDMVEQMAALGFNTLRLPFSTQMFDHGSFPEGIDYRLNPELAGLDSLQIVDKVIEQAGHVGMRVMLDRHRASADGQEKLWYSEQYPEQRWIEDWTMLAERYRGNPTVIGAELHNEPNSAEDPEGLCWGCGVPSRDWRLAAERAGNAILAANPDWLIVVQGIDCVTMGEKRTCVWRGGNLMGARGQPVRLTEPNKLVYSAHDYGNSVYGNSWFDDPGFPGNMPELWDQWWGHLDREAIAPVAITEFATTFQDPRNDAWMRALLNHLGTGPGGMDFCFWVWNPGSYDADGVLNQDWVTVNPLVRDLLAPYVIPPRAPKP
jgi:endoglucanase